MRSRAALVSLAMLALGCGREPQAALNHQFGRNYEILYSTPVSAEYRAYFLQLPKNAVAPTVAIVDTAHWVVAAYASLAAITGCTKPVQVSTTAFFPMVDVAAGRVTGRTAVASVRFTMNHKAYTAKVLSDGFWLTPITAPPQGSSNPVEVQPLDYNGNPIPACVF